MITPARSRCSGGSRRYIAWCLIDESKMSEDPILNAIARLRVDVMSRLDRHGNRLTAIEGRLTGVEGRLTGVEGRLEDVEHGLSAIRDEITVALGASDDARRANDNTRESVRNLTETVSILIKKVRTLEARVEAIEGKKGGAAPQSTILFQRAARRGYFCATAADQGEAQSLIPVRVPSA